MENDPARVFAGLPVEIVSAFFPQSHPAAYIRNPGDAPWREEGWGVWYAPGRPDAALASLSAITGRQGYLILSTADATWRVYGRVALKPVRWQPDSYNFTGFCVDPESPPTFQEFFAPSRAHRGQRIYQLVDGAWTPVRNPESTAIRTGEAYWVYCAGGSDYQGPLQVRSAGSSLDLGRFAPDGRIELLNHLAQPVRVQIAMHPVENALPLAYVSQELSQLRTSYPPMPDRLVLPELEPGHSQLLRIAPRRDAMTAGSQTSLLRISNGEGTVIWLPVTAQRAL